MQRFRSLTRHPGEGRDPVPNKGRRFASSFFDLVWAPAYAGVTEILHV